MKTLALISISLLLGACHINNNKHHFTDKKEKHFYSDYGGYDYIRFPLIMPYDVMCIDVQELDWIVDLKPGTDFYNSISQTKDVAVSNGIIMVHSASTHRVLVDEPPKQWFVIIPARKIEIGFATEMEFQEYLKAYSIKEINWIEVNSAYKQFEDSRCLPWIPGCFN